MSFGDVDPEVAAVTGPRLQYLVIGPSVERCNVQLIREVKLWKQIAVKTTVF